MQSPELFAALTNRSILDQRFASSLNKQTTEALQELAKWLRERINREGAAIASRKRYQKLLDDVEAKTAQVYEDITALYYEQFKALSADEAEFITQAIQASVVTDVIVESPSNRKLWAAVTKNPLAIGGNNSFVDFDEMIERLGDNSRKVASVISGGFSQGLTLQEMTQTIVGTRAQKYTDGIIDASRREAETIVRTAVTHIASTSRDEIFRQNDDIIWGYTILATLDTRTSETCRYFDGKTFKYSDSYNPKPAFHYRCRSQITAEFYNDKLNRTGSTRSANFEDEKGQVDATKQYYDVLKRQPAYVQDEVLGKSRGLIFRNAGLSAQEFRDALANRMGEPLTLAEMAQKNQKILEYMKKNEFLKGYI